MLELWKSQPYSSSLPRTRNMLQLWKSRPYSWRLPENGLTNIPLLKGCPSRIPARKVNDYWRATCPRSIKTKSCMGFVFVISGVRVWATVYAFGL
ncbi:unnamed protein product [Brassica oleracea var. botrytis]